MPINDLPLELLETVFVNLRSTDLAECQLVCRKWHQAAELKLYKNVDFRTEKSLHQFTRFIQTSQYSIFPYGLLVESIHFNIFQVFSIHTFIVNVRTLLQYCCNTRSISSNNIISNSILQPLSSLPEDIQLEKLESIPLNDYGIYYHLCARKFHQSLTELNLQDHQSNQELVLNHGFPNLTRLMLGTCSQPLNVIYSVLKTSARLQYLKFRLTSPLVESPKLTEEYPSLRELEISTKLEHGLDYVVLNEFLYKFINVEKITMSVFDRITNSQSLDKLYAIRDIISWINKRSDSKLCIKNFKDENLFTYLKFIFNTIPLQKEDWNNKLVFFHTAIHTQPFISYSTHTGYKERTMAITMNDYFANNFVCNYLNRLELPFNVYVQ